MSDSAVQDAPKKRSRWWLWVLGTLPLWCCPLWILVNWGYERFEIWQLDRLVDDARIPGYIAAKDAKNDWPMGVSNGAYIRVHWLVVTDEPRPLTDFVEGLELPPNVEADLYDLGPAPGAFAREASAVVLEDMRLYLFTVDTGRGPYQWEFPD
ncbi:MAG: hypothetical protein WD716_10780 [Fimbriimonadaceae bacterium]